MKKLLFFVCIACLTTVVWASEGEGEKVKAAPKASCCASQAKVAKQQCDSKTVVAKAETKAVKAASVPAAKASAMPKASAAKAKSSCSASAPAAKTAAAKGKSCCASKATKSGDS